MSNYILQLPLKTEKWQADIIDKRLEIGRQIYNALLNVTTCFSRGSVREEDTYVICGEIWQHPEIEDISDQIWNELLELYERDESWSIRR